MTEATLTEATVTQATLTEATLALAQTGDGEAFGDLVEPHRRELLAHCYRMLGSVQDAEDVLQEVLVAAWRSLGQFDGRELRGWLYRIATNRSLNHLRDQSRRPRTPGPGQPGDPSWLEPYPDALDAPDGPGALVPGPEAQYDAAESIALSFIAGLQQLPPQQRAVLVLRDVLGFPAAQTAEILGTSAAAVNSALIRARTGLPTDRQPQDVPVPRSAAEAVVVDRFVSAFQRFDLEELVRLLTDDARLTMPPEPEEHRGAESIARFLVQVHQGWQIKVLPTRANGQPALVLYLAGADAPLWQACGLIVFTLRGDQVRALTRFMDPNLLTRFGYPRTLARS